MDEDQALKETRDPVAPTKKSAGAKQKASSKKNVDGSIVHSFKSRLADLSTIVRNVCQVPSATATNQGAFTMTTTPAATRQKAFDLIKNIKL